MNVHSYLQPINACGSRGSSSKGTAKQLVMWRLKSDTWIPCHSSHVFTQIFHHQCLTQQGANHPLGGSFGYLASVLRCQVLVPTDWLDANPTKNMLHVVIWSVWQPSWIRPRPGCSGRRLQEGRSDGRPHPFCPNKGIALQNPSFCTQIILSGILWHKLNVNKNKHKQLFHGRTGLLCVLWFVLLLFVLGIILVIFLLLMLHWPS